DVRQKVHLDLDDAVTLTGLAAPALDIEREAARRVTARLGFREPRIPITDRRETPGIRRRVRARRAADRGLVDVDDLIENLDALEPVKWRRLFARVVEPLGERLVQGLDDQGRLAAARDTGHTAKRPERNLGGDVLQIIARRPAQREDLSRMSGTA